MSGLVLVAMSDVLTLPPTGIAATRKKRVSKAILPLLALEGVVAHSGARPWAAS